MSITYTRDYILIANFFGMALVPFAILSVLNFRLYRKIKVMIWMMIIVAMMYFMIITVLEKDPKGSKVLDRKIYLVSTSEIKAGKEQFDNEGNLFANNHLFRLSYFHTPLISVSTRKLRKTVSWFFKAVVIFQYQYEAFFLFRRNFEVIKKGYLLDVSRKQKNICSAFPESG